MAVFGINGYKGLVQTQEQHSQQLRAMEKIQYRMVGMAGLVSGIVAALASTVLVKLFVGG